MSLVEIQIIDRIAHIIINAPPVNALNKQVFTELSSILDTVDSNVDVVIVSGKGEKAFVAGADITEFPELTKETGIELCKRGQEVFNKIERLPQPVIAAIEGYALGGGLELALACDFRIATIHSQFGFPEVKLGIIPGYGGTQRLARIVGIGKAKQLIFSGEIISANEAKGIGVIEELTGGSAINLAEEWANKIIKNGPLAVANAKHAITFGIDLELSQGLSLEANLFGDICETEDKSEGVAAFLEKRTPKFQKK